MSFSPEQSIALISGDRVAAHETLFAHRRLHDGKRVPSAPFHPELIEALHSPHPRVVGEAFRGAAKSTLAEEATIIQAALVEFRNCLIIGASYERATERLEAIGHEIDTNEDLLSAFGPLHGGGTWTESKKLLSNGVYLQAKGAGQSLRGVKYHDLRPDYVLIDDLEDEESTRTPAARQEMLRWLFKTLLPALARNARIRFIGSRLDPDAVIVKIATDRQWKHLRYPIMYKDAETGADTPAWPAYFPLSRIYEIRDEYARQGLFEDFNQEYMCEADAPEDKIYRPEHFAGIVKEEMVRTWQATWAMVDPARSIGKRSATTAIPIWSWIGNRLILWDCRIGNWMPDEIIDQIMQVDTEFRPVMIGVEEDALNQFILQPLRQAQVRLSHPLPIKPMAAKKYTEGRGKLDFIKSLQPFFAAHEVVFAKPLPELQAQFLSFPKGAIDGPNALAYALKMRPGVPVYDEFTQANVVQEVAILPSRPLYLAMNATAAVVTAILVQYDGTTLRIIADWVEEGDPGQRAGAVVRLAQLEAGQKMRPVAPASHFEQWSNVGLRQALARVPANLDRGGDPLVGQDEIRTLLRGATRGFPAVQVAHAARWTLNAFSGGYARALVKGSLATRAEESVYVTLMTGLEAFAALLQVERGVEEADGLNYRESGGRRYISAMPDRG